VRIGAHDEIQPRRKIHLPPIEAAKMPDFEGAEKLRVES
jgi:hypothetical protein